MKKKVAKSSEIAELSKQFIMINIEVRTTVHRTHSK